MSKPSMAVVIPTYGHFDYARDAVETLLDCTSGVTPHVIVVDDASPDWSEAWADEVRALGPGVDVFRFEENGGLTRSWNRGLRAAANCRDEYACVTNSDVLFTPGWDLPFLRVLAKCPGALLGPLTNAPGNCPHQYVGHWSKLYANTGDPWSEHSRSMVAGELSDNWYDEDHWEWEFVEAEVNGFCMVARTYAWSANAYDGYHVFRPRNNFDSAGRPNPTPLMTLNECELQARWKRRAGFVVGFCKASYVFHYRAVSRGDRHLRGDWARKP